MSPEPLARSTDPETSHQAADAIRRSRDNLMRECLSAIQAAGKRGLTSGEVAEATGMAHPSAWRRCSDLNNEGYTLARGTRLWKPTNRKQTVYVCALFPEGVPGGQ